MTNIPIDQVNYILDVYSYRISSPTISVVYNKQLPRKLLFPLSIIKGLMIRRKKIRVALLVNNIVYLSTGCGTILTPALGFAAITSSFTWSQFLFRID